MPLGALAGEIVLDIPLPMPGTDRTDPVELPGAVTNRNAIERMRIAGTGTGDDAGFMGHGEGLSCD